MRKRAKKIGILMLMPALCGMIGGGCAKRTTENIVRTDSVVEREIRYDKETGRIRDIERNWDRDSVIIMIRGDSVREREVRERTRWLIHHDTIEREKRDTIVEIRDVREESRAPERGKSRNTPGMIWIGIGMMMIISILIWIKRDKR